MLRGSCNLVDLLLVSVFLSQRFMAMYVAHCRHLRESLQVQGTDNDLEVMFRHKDFHCIFIIGFDRIPNISVWFQRCIEV